ncbi:MAG TPA: hypothetical protein VK981_16485 [Ramlibacter sp.]|nr:hypothetical protein [Ramlibacter sp.]
MGTLGIPRSHNPQAVLVLGGFGLAALVAWLCVQVNLERACTVQDSPYLQVCALPEPASIEHLASLRSRLARNPGDANAQVQLAVSDGSSAQAALLAAATKLAPNQPNVVMAHAAAALEREDWAGAVAPLVQLVEYRNAAPAAAALARLIAGGQGALLAPYVTPGSQWLPRVLARLPELKTSFNAALPLVVHASRLGVLDREAVRGYVRQLKAAGAWGDAYSLWLASKGGPRNILNNPGFDDAFEADGFDWEVPASGPPSRAGAIIERKGAQERGSALDVRFTGRALATPLVRQYLFVGEGRYRLRGDYMTRQLRMEQGLAWTVQCTASPAQAGRSLPLGDTGGGWRPFAFEFSVPADCGLVASLQLETHAPFEAALGARGRAAFDAFSLEKLAP